MVRWARIVQWEVTVPNANIVAAKTLATKTLAFALLICAGSASAFEARLDVTGNADLRGDIRAASAILQAETEGVTTSEEIIAAVQSDYGNLLGALYRAGYYGPSISIRVDGREGADLSLISLPRSVDHVTITVDTGPRFVFGRAEIAPLAPGTVLPEGFAPGEVAEAGLVGDASDAAIEAWRQASYAKATRSSERITANHSTEELNVNLGIDPGQKARFGTLSFAGSSQVKEGRLVRIANFPSGSAYDPDTLTLVSNRLQKTGTFRSITLREADTLNPDGTLDVTATLVDEKRHRFGFGAEVSSLEGGTLSAYWMHRNLTNHADRFRIDGEVSGLGGTTGTDYSLSMSYRRPATVSRKTTGVLAFEVEHLDEEDFRSDTGEFTVGADVESSLVSTFSASVGYRYSDVEDDLGHRTFHHLIFPIEGTRDKRDSTLNPTDGTYYAADITPFVGLKGSAGGVHAYAEGRGYKSFGADEQFTVAGRLQLGSIVGADYTEVPADMLFHSGGGGTVRGHPYQSLGVDDGGISTGGSSYFGTSLELRSEIKGPFSVVGFFDIGAIGATALPTEGAEWHSGAGLGLRYDTGVGPIRLDVAAPVTGDTGDGVQIYIGIGQAF